MKDEKGDFYAKWDAVWGCGTRYKDCNILFYLHFLAFHNKMKIVYTIYIYVERIIHRMKKALITGITGQDGSYLAEFLLEKGYEVHGIVRRASISNTARIDHLIADNAITLHDGDLSGIYFRALW